jgi:hypothetical protein
MLHSPSDQWLSYSYAKVVVFLIHCSMATVLHKVYVCETGKFHFTRATPGMEGTVGKVQKW